jgi:hypothetical protein
MSKDDKSIREKIEEIILNSYDPFNKQGDYINEKEATDQILQLIKEEKMCSHGYALSENCPYCESKTILKGE